MKKIFKYAATSIMMVILFMMTFPVASHAAPMPANCQTFLPPTNVTITLDGYLGTDTLFHAVTVSGGTIIDGVYGGWCADLSGVIHPATYQAVAYSSYDPACYGIINHEEYLPQVNWILNQGFVGKTANDTLPPDAGGNGYGEPLGNYTYGDVQAAIWSLLEYGVDYTPHFNLLGSWSADRRDEILAAANASGQGFVPGCGQLVAIILDPGQGVQKVIIGVKPDIKLIKEVDPDTADAGEEVTYTYTVQNTGSVKLTNIIITDDNGTPGYPADDFVVGTIPSLAPGEEESFEVTRIPPECLCVNINGTSYGNLLLIETVPDQNGDGIPDIKVTYRQNRNIVDNVYGAPANDPASGWYPKHHNFSDFTGSDKAQFRFTDSLGNVVLDFKVDYISASKAYQSGFGTLGVTGGDGGMIVGSAASVLDFSTTITTNLNQSPSFYGFTTNSPTPESDFPTWDYADGYTVVVDGALFEANGFGNATVYSVHNSPPKIGTNEALPKPCDSDLTNTATVTTKAGNTTLTTTASSTVHIVGGATVVASPFTTYKQEQWGGDPKKPGVAKLLSQDFSAVYPAGVSVGGTYSLTFDSADAVLKFLPQKGKPQELKSSATNPTKTNAGELAGHVLALQLNVDFSNAGILPAHLAGLHLKSGKLATKSVAEVLNLANQVLGGNKALLPAGVSLNDLKDIVKKINENYEKGTHDRGYLQ